MSCVISVRLILGSVQVICTVAPQHDVSSAGSLAVDNFSEIIFQMVKPFPVDGMVLLSLMRLGRSQN